MRSMTGFGQGAHESDRLRVSVTLRGVNHRYLDLVLRLRDEYRDAEIALRELLATELSRGRVETVVEIEPLGRLPVEVEIDESLVAALAGAQHQLVARDLVMETDLRFADLLRLPDVVKLQPRPLEWTAADQEVLLAAARTALEQFVAARSTEGEKLRAILVSRLDALAALVEDLTVRRREIGSEMLASLRERLAELLGDEPTGRLDEDRLAQEVAILVDKSDVREELDRLGSHLEHFRALMERPGSLGKRLDFLSQEIFRELNTVGSKCRDSAMTRLVLDGKAVCEQIREQVQNIE